MKNINENFAGDKKSGESLLTSLEKRVVSSTVHLVPSWLETYHLTYLTLIWSIGVILCGILTKESLNWLWGINLMIFFQYVTDLYDGAVGRFRKTGLIKWGFFMDHFLDFIFLSSLAFAGFIMAPIDLAGWYFILLILLSAFMVGSFLSFSATNVFEIYVNGIGPTEFRILLIIINTIIIYTGLAHLSYTLPLTCLVISIGLVWYILRTSRMLWNVDMNAKDNKD